MIKQSIILASRSKIRCELLRSVGVSFKVHPANIDETAILTRVVAAGETMENLAMTLAEAKARLVSSGAEHSGALVVGSDQVLDLDGAALEAPDSAEAAAERLQALRGRTHGLVSGLAIVRDGEVLTQTAQRVTIRMRDFSDAELRTYLDRIDESALYTVGGYELEGLGAQLIEAIEGDWFAALGLPLLPLLEALRRLEAEPH